MPYVKNGRGMPTAGSMSVTMPMLMMVERAMGARRPIASSWSSNRDACSEINSSLVKRDKKSKSTSIAPIKPHSSHTTENIKSVRASGKNESLFWVPFMRPFP